VEEIRLDLKLDDMKKETAFRFQLLGIKINIDNIKTDAQVRSAMMELRSELWNLLGRTLVNSRIDTERAYEAKQQSDAILIYWGKFAKEHNLKENNIGLTVGSDAEGLRIVMETVKG